MWWSRTLAILLALGLAGCGFRPMYGEMESSAGVGPQLAQIRVLAIADRQGQQLRNTLVQLLTPAGDSAPHAYSLEVKVTTQLSGTGYQKTAEATMGTIDARAQFILKDRDGRAVFSGTTLSILNFNYIGPRYGSVVQERDAEDRAMQDIAQDIRRQLAAFFITRQQKAQ